GRIRRAARAHARAAEARGARGRRAARGGRRASMNGPAERPIPSAADLLFLAGLFGLGAGLTEAAVWAVQRYGLNQLTSLSYHVVWMAPVVYAVLLGAFALVLALMLRVARQPRFAGVAVFLLALPAVYAVLLLVPR